MEATGNDLILVEAQEDKDTNWAEVARAMCARRWGIGSDGLLVLARGQRAPRRMRMFNPDGTEDMCGNGLRCVATYLQRRGRLRPEGGALETIAGLRRVRPVEGGLIEAEVGEPGLRPEDLPMQAEGDSTVDWPVEVDGERRVLTGVSMGTPHAVLLTDQPVSDEVFLRVSPRIEVHPMFPERTTVTWCCVQGRDLVQARFWERAVGESLSCGTGACAAVVAARLKGLVGDEVQVHMAGGEAQVRWKGSGSVLLVGPAREVFEGEWPYRPGGGLGEGGE